ncbi:MAG: hypothetical protein IPH62_08285 [Ignavibacteriae bacterium]|nr:hypothetical protein [Ignavibacteriota bacterium]
MKSNILIDAHIHIHECFDLNTFFNSAKSNFQNQANKINCDNFQSVLCLTESHKANYFANLFDKAETNEKIGNWEIVNTPNQNSIILKDKDSFEIFLIAGRQIVTKENLEVLALGLNEDPNDGNPIEEVIKFVNANKAISVIPWGVGKWMGNRKQIVEKLVLQNNTFPIYLGDNGNRPFFWSKPEIFNEALKNGIINIPGSDPLPFLNEVKKPGSFGFIIDGNLDKEKPFDSIYEKINSSKIQFKTYGKLETGYNFLKNQISMQIVKRSRK